MIYELQKSHKERTLRFHLKCRSLGMFLDKKASFLRGRLVSRKKMVFFRGSFVHSFSYQKEFLDKFLELKSANK